MIKNRYPHKEYVKTTTKKSKRIEFPGVCGEPISCSNRTQGSAREITRSYLREHEIAMVVRFPYME